MQVCHFFYTLLRESPAAEFLPINTSAMPHTKVGLNYKAALIQYEYYDAKWSYAYKDFQRSLSK